GRGACGLLRDRRCGALGQNTGSGVVWGRGAEAGFGLGVAHAEARSFFSRGAAESAEEVAGPGCVRRGAERSSPGSTFVLNVVSSGGIPAQPAAEGAGRGRLHAVSPPRRGA